MCMCIHACVCVHMCVRDRERGTDQSKETGKAFCFVSLMSLFPCLRNKGFLPCYFALGFTNAVASCVDSLKDKLPRSWVIYFCCLLNPRSIWVWVFDTRVHLEVICEICRKAPWVSCVWTSRSQMTRVSHTTVSAFQIFSSMTVILYMIINM